MNTWLMRRAGAQPRLPGDDRAEELIGVQAPFHQQLGVALAHELDGLGRRRVAVRDVDDRRRTERDAALLRDLADLGRGADEDRRDESFRAGLDRAGERGLLTGMRDGRRHGREALASLQQRFVLSGSGWWSHDRSFVVRRPRGEPPGRSRGGGVRKIARPTP